MIALLYKFGSIMESATMAVFWGWGGTKHDKMVTSGGKKTLKLKFPFSVPMTLS